MENMLKKLFELALRVGVKMKTVRMRNYFDKGTIVNESGFYLRRNSRRQKPPLYKPSTEAFSLKINGVYIRDEYIPILFFRLEELILQLGDKEKVKKEMLARKKRSKLVKKTISEEKEATRAIIKFLGM